MTIKMGIDSLVGQFFCKILFSQNDTITAPSPNCNSCITFEQFGVLLERFVNQKMYLYFDDATSGNFEKVVHSAKTYRSYLTGKFGSEYVDNLLKLNGF